MINFTPNSTALQIGPITIEWYGVFYAIGLSLAFLVVTSEARRRKLSTDVITNGMIFIAVAALIGGRAYHVIDQWALYKDDLPKIFLPPYSGLGAYGGLATGILALFVYCRYKKLEFWTWMDIAAPAVFVMQGVARWGNFFNQELYGPPTNLPWGIAIDCAHRVAEFACPPVGTTPVDAHFQPLFLYESISGFLGAATLLFLARRFPDRLRPGDLAAIFLIWYGLVRFALEYMRQGYNWTFFGIPTAQLVSLGFVGLAFLILLYRHRPGAAAGEAKRKADLEAATADNADRPDTVTDLDLPEPDELRQPSPAGSGGVVSPPA
jgi:phosphatidylglycerol:prolipoprotein diacylglycerol transferase